MSKLETIYDLKQCLNRVCQELLEVPTTSPRYSELLARKDALLAQLLGVPSALTPREQSRGQLPQNTAHVLFWARDGMRCSRCRAFEPKPDSPCEPKAPTKAP